MKLCPEQQEIFTTLPRDRGLRIIPRVSPIEEQFSTELFPNSCYREETLKILMEQVEKVSMVDPSMTRISW